MLKNFIGSVGNYMSYLTARRDIISNNIANANTPGYKAKDAQFLEQLENSGVSSVSLYKTNPRHFPISTMQRTPYAIKANHLEINEDGNSVDTTKEMIELMKTNHLYSIAVQTINTEKAIGQAARGK